MGLSCFSRPAVAADDITAERTWQSGSHAHDAERDPLSSQQQQQPLSPVRSGLSAAAAAAVTAAMPALDLSTAAVTVVSEPLASLSTRFQRLLMAEASPAGGDGDALQHTLRHSGVESSAGSFLSARSDSLSDAGSWAAEEGERGQHEATTSTPADHRHGRRNLTAALLIDSPSVFGPLPDPCSSPTFRQLSDPSMRGCLHQEALHGPPSRVSVNLLRRLSSSRSKGPAPSSPSLTAGSLRSYSSGLVPVLDSVSSMVDDTELIPAAEAAGSGTAPGHLPPRARTLLKRAATAYAAGQVLAADVLARHAAAMAGCTTLLELAAVDPDSSAHALMDSAAAPDTTAAGRQPEQHESNDAAAANSSPQLDLRQLEADAAAVHVCMQQLAATRQWASTKEGGLRIQYHHEKAGSAVHSVRVEAEYDWPSDRIFSVAREFDVVGSHNRFALDHGVLAEPSAFESIVYAGTWLPFPMKPFELVLSVRWVDLVQEEGIVLIMLSDAAERLGSIPGAKPLPAKSPSRRRGHLLPGSCGYMRPLPPGPDGRPRTRCIILAHLDTGMSYIPGFIVSFVLKVMSPFLFKSTKRLLSESFASDHAELPRRIAAKEGVYGPIRDAEREAIRMADRQNRDLHTLSCASEVLQKPSVAGMAVA